MTTKPKRCWVYAIEINPGLIPQLGRMAPKGTTRFVYVGYTERGPRERLSEHLQGVHRPDDFSKSAGDPFKKIRKWREAQGLPGPLVDGTDAWMLVDLVEEYVTPAEGHPREGGLADEIGHAPGTYAWSNVGGAAAARGEAAAAKEKRKAQRAKRKARKAAEPSGD